MDNLDDLKLRRLHDHNDMQLDKLVFKYDRICFYTSMERHMLENISVIKGTFDGNYQMTETEYDRIQCPIYHISADIGPNGQEGVIRGIIRPRIDMDTAKLLTNFPPILHFYRKEGSSITLGHSIYVKDYGPETILIGMMPWESKDFEKFVKRFMPNAEYLPSWFEAKVDKKYEEKGMLTSRC